MNLSFDTGAVIEGYRSKTQLARILTETWVARNMYCPRCGHTHITHFENNRPVAGFSVLPAAMNILACINRVAAQKFTLEDIYRYERELQAKHPQNHHIRPKIRQQLQFLRDLGYITFMGHGKYQIIR